MDLGWSLNNFNLPCAESPTNLGAPNGKENLNCRRSFSLQESREKEPPGNARHRSARPGVLVGGIDQGQGGPYDNYNTITSRACMCMRTMVIEWATVHVNSTNIGSAPNQSRRVPG